MVNKHNGVLCLLFFFIKLVSLKLQIQLLDNTLKKTGAFYLLLTRLEGLRIA